MNNKKSDKVLPRFFYYNKERVSIPAKTYLHAERV